MFDLDEFVGSCRSVLSEPHPSVAVREVLERALARPREIERALGVPERGGLVSLHRSEDLTVLQVVWPPGVSLFPHDHRMWAANGIYGGREDNTFYRRGPDTIVVLGGKTLDTGQTALLGRDTIHSVVNPAAPTQPPSTCTAATTLPPREASGILSPSPSSLSTSSTSSTC